jgi:hypothetical protein
VVVAASFPHRLRHLSATVLQCLRHGVWGGGSGGSGARQQCRAPSRYSRTRANRDGARNALGPGATTKLECAPPSGVGGDFGLGGACRRTVLGGKGVHRRDNNIPKVSGRKSTNCGSGAWPQQLRTDQAFRCPALTQRSPYSAASATKANKPQG